MKRFILVLLSIMLVAGVVACSAASEVSWDEDRIATTTATMTQTVVASAPSEGLFKNGVTITQMPAPTITIPPVNGEELGYGTAAGTEVDPMIVRTGQISLVLEDVVQAVDDITAMAKGYGGYVVSSSSWREGETLVGNINIRVLADNFDEAMASLRNMADDVSSETTSSQDVTDEYVDLAAELKVMKATETQMLAILEEARTVDDTLAVYDKLDEIQKDIARTEGRMQYLEQSSSTSLIQIHVQQSAVSVSFYARNTTLKSGESTRFYAEVGGGFTPYSYEWDFGDGDTSTDENPSHVYKSAGKYTVTLTVNDDRSHMATETREDYIGVEPGWSAGSVAGNAWSGLSTFGRGLVNVLIWLGIFSPVWIVAGVIVWWLVRRVRNSRRKAS